MRLGISAGRAAPWAVGALVLAALMAPMVLTDRSFGTDWGGHLWLIRAQTQNVVDLGHPSYFVQSSLGAFYPWFAFYGATLYGATGAVAAAVGQHVTATYVASFAAAMALAYGGMTWLARQAGLRGWAAHVPGIAFLTSAYYVTDVYARGAWPETIAISALPLLLAAALSTVRATRPRPGPVAALVVAAAIVSGSHNITLVWGGIFVVAVAVVALIAVSPERRRLGRRLGFVAALLLLGVAINLWFLLIAIRLRHQVPVETSERPSVPELTLGVLVSPFRFSRFGAANPTFDLQAPILLLLWSGLALWLAPLRSRTTRRLAAGLALLLVPLALLLVVQSTWELVPHELWVIQFPYRLETYVVLCVAGLLILALVGLARASGRRRTLLVRSLVAILAIETGQAVAQAWRTPSFLRNRHEVYAHSPTQAPRWWEVFAPRNEFGDIGARVVRPTLASIPGVTVPGLPAVTYTGEAAQTLSLPVTRLPIRSRYELRFPLRQPGLVVTNVIGSPRLVAVSGARPVGRTPDSRMIVQVEPAADRVHVAFSTARTRGVVAGWVGSILALVATLAVVVFLAVRRSPGPDA